MAWWFFVPPERTFIKQEPKYILYSLVYVGLELAISIVYEKLIHAKKLIEASLVDTETANTNLKIALDERQIFASLVENSSDFIGTADPDGVPNYLNPAGRAMVGLSPISTLRIPGSLIIIHPIRGSLPKT